LIILLLEPIEPMAPGFEAALFEGDDDDKEEEEENEEEEEEEEEEIVVGAECG
jgi:hypothetical protein